MKRLLVILLLLSIGLNGFLGLQLARMEPPASQGREPAVTSTPLTAPPLSVTDKIYADALRGRLPEAMREFSGLSASEQLNVLKRWQSHIQELLDTLQLDAAETLLSELLLHSPYRPELLLLEARRLQIEGLNLDALEIYLTVYDQNMPYGVQAKVAAAIRSLGLMQLAQWHDQQAWTDLEQLATQLLDILPGEDAFRVLLAKSYAHQGALGLMESTLLEVGRLSSADTAYFDRFRRSTENVGDAGDRIQQVALERTGEHFVVQAFLDRDIAADLLIDTGASTTTIDAGVFEQIRRNLNVRVIGATQITTAGGVVDGSLYEIDEFAVGNYRLSNFKVVVVPLEGLKADGLLGMNFLRRFQFQIDQDAQMLALEPKN